VADFFATFTLVPDASSHAFREWMNEAAPSDHAAASVSLKKAEAIQVCDHTMTTFFLDSLLRYPWPRSMRAQVGKDLHQFVLNQQTRVAPLEARAVVANVLLQAREKKLVPGSVSAARKIRKEIQSVKLSLAPPAEIPPEDLESNSEQAIRKELKASEHIREELGKQLPMP
jgi:hypothetical protein